MIAEEWEDNEEYFDDQPLGPSKSQLKREAHALQRLGEQLVALKPAQLQKLPLTEELHTAITTAQKMKQRGAFRRQLQFIGRLMRQTDAEPIQSALDSLQSGSVAARRQQRDLEKLCEALLQDEQTTMAELFELHPEVDRQHLRQLVRNVQREQQQDKPAKARKALLGYLRELTAEPPS